MSSEITIHHLIDLIGDHCTHHFLIEPCRWELRREASRQAKAQAVALFGKKANICIHAAGYCVDMRRGDE